jgi:tetratricopeptide (TPR) repeat protein
MAHHNLKHYDAAIAGYTRALGLDPDFVKSMTWRGFTRRLLGDYDGAASDFEHVLKLAPGDTWTLSNLAKTRQARGEYDACEEALRRAAELEPVNGRVRAQLGFLLAVLGSTSRSIAEFEAALMNHAPEETYVRVWIWMQRADREHADRELRAWFDDARIEDIWELQLTAFLLGEGTDEQLIGRADAETRARVSRGDPSDFLECEATFYAGLRHEFRGERESAHELYERTRTLSAAEAWEWHMARVRARSVAR